MRIVDGKLKFAGLIFCLVNSVSAEVHARSSTKNCGGSGTAPIDASRVTGFGVVASDAFYRGSCALLLKVDRVNVESDATFARLDGIQLRNFTLEAILAGRPLRDDSDARGFVGISFRISNDAEKFEAVYIRPTNGRADDQLRRNHSTQYISHPGHPWEQLRKDHPGKYESYADLEAGAWTRLRLVVRESSARLYVNGGRQPALIVNDLKLPVARGGVGLWVGPGSAGYFKSVKILSGEP